MGKIAKIVIAVVALIAVALVIAYMRGPAAVAPTDERDSMNARPPSGQPASGATHVIVMKESGYVPATLAIRVGDTVTFRNDGTVNLWPASNIHPTHDIYPEFDPQKPVAPGESWSFTFDKAGIWRMHDHLLPRIVGTVTVE